MAKKDTDPRNSPYFWERAYARQDDDIADFIRQGREEAGYVYSPDGVCLYDPKGNVVDEEAEQWIQANGDPRRSGTPSG